MVSYLTSRHLTGDKVYAEIVALSTDTVDTGHLANGSTLYQMDKDKEFRFDEESGAWKEYVQPGNKKEIKSIGISLNKYGEGEGIIPEKAILSCVKITVSSSSRFDDNAIVSCVMVPEVDTASKLNEKIPSTMMVTAKSKGGEEIGGWENHFDSSINTRTYAYYTGRFFKLTLTSDTSKIGFRGDTVNLYHADIYYII